jgi:hypothetical protein
MRILRLKEVLSILDSSSILTAMTVLETIEGDSLSRENMGAYIEILRNCGALGESG